MIASALIDQCRRAYNDVPKTTQVAKAADGTSVIFNVGKFPVIEGSYTIYFGTSAKVDVTDFTMDVDNGDLRTTQAQANGLIIKSNHKHANFNNKQWNEAINHGIERLNARGFFKQSVRTSGLITLSAGKRTYNGPSACVDLYELLQSSNNGSTGTPQRLPGNWSYQQDANKVILGYSPSRSGITWASYLRNLKTYAATSATLDVLTDWTELVKLAAGSYYFRAMASKIAQEGNASIEEGHYSFTNLRTMANDLDAEFDLQAKRKKPTRPAKEIQYHLNGGGVA